MQSTVIVGSRSMVWMVFIRSSTEFHLARNRFGLVGPLSYDTAIGHHPQVERVAIAKRMFHAISPGEPGHEEVLCDPRNRRQRERLPPLHGHMVSSGRHFIRRAWGG
jgi:hypothetical protein